eukprot:scaffold3918_cov342-Pinguiococcus_pyrenoidosus.AAC.2
MLEHQQDTFTVYLLRTDEIRAKGRVEDILSDDAHNVRREEAWDVGLCDETRAAVRRLLAAAAAALRASWCAADGFGLVENTFLAQLAAWRMRGCRRGRRRLRKRPAGIQGL